MNNFSVSKNVFVVIGYFYVVVNESVTLFTNKNNFPINAWRLEKGTIREALKYIRLYTQPYDKIDEDQLSTIRIWKEKNCKEYMDFIVPDFNLSIECYDAFTSFLQQNCEEIELLKQNDYDN